MIPTRHAELLNLPPETSPREAQGDCLPLQQELLAINPALPPPKKPLSGPEEVLNDVSNGAPPETAPTPQSGAEFCGTVPVEFLSVLDLDENANAEQALAKAQARLKETVDAQSSLKPRHPAHPKLKRDRARFEQMTAELREIVFSGKVDALCDRTEEALECRPPNRAKARDCVRRARTEGTHLQPESACLRRLQKLEMKLEGGDADSATAPISNEAASAPAPVHAAPPFVAPAENPFLRLESLVDKGMACLAQDYPDVSGAIESSAEAQAEADGKEVPSNLRSRMQLFKRTLEQVRREAIHARVDECLRQAAAAMAQDPPATDETREKLHLAESLLKEAPDSYFRSEVARLERVIEEHEHWLSTRRSNEMELLAETRPASPPIEAHPLPAEDYVYPTMPLPRAPEQISVKVNPKARSQILPLPPRSMAPMAPEITIRPPVQPTLSLKPAKRSKALEFGVALLVIGLISAACASFRIAGMLSTLMGHSGNIQSNQPVQPSEFFAEKPAPQTFAPLFSRRPEIGELSVSVTPEDAELFTNGVSLGHQAYPVNLRGVTGQELLLTAKLEGYSNATKTVVFPGPHSLSVENLELQPKPALLIVHSEPAASEIFLRKGTFAPAVVARLDDGIELAPSVPIEVSLDVPDYDSVRTNLPALKPGERKLIDFGKLKLQTAALHLKVYPPDAQFSVIYDGHDSVPCGSKTLIEGIVPRVAFQVIAERPGYASASNSFLLKPREVVDYDFGKLKPLSASLVVTATPAKFDLKVAWDGASKDYGAEGRAAGLPPGKNLLVTVSATGHQPASTNLILQPGERKELYFGGLQPAVSSLLLKSDPPGGDVTYRIDGHFPIFAGVTDHIDGLPLGHDIEVTLHKTGYMDRPMTHKLLLAGDTLDFGHLTPLTYAPPVESPTAYSEPEKSATFRPVRTALNSQPVRSATNSQVAKPAPSSQTQSPTNSIQSASNSLPAKSAQNLPATQSTTNSQAAKFTLTSQPAKSMPSLQTAQYNTTSIETLLKQIDVHIAIVRLNVPLTETSRRDWNEWISKVEAMHRNNALVWTRLQPPLRTLRELVNQTTPFSTVPVANHR